jgi:hypothetical protein
MIPNILEPGSSQAFLDHFPITDLLPDTHPGQGYWTYHGSLTTPPCSNTVTWIVSDKYIKIPGYQVKQHQKGDDKLVGPQWNLCRFRPLVLLLGLVRSLSPLSETRNTRPPVSNLIM